LVKFIKKYLYKLTNLLWIISDPEDPILIFSNRHEIRRVNLTDRNFMSLVSGLRNTIALDYYYNKTDSLVFWTDVVDDKIYKGSLLAEGWCDLMLFIVINSNIIWFGLNQTAVKSRLRYIHVKASMMRDPWTCAWCVKKLSGQSCLQN
jgi:hypothetical protein